MFMSGSFMSAPFMAVQATGTAIRWLLGPNPPPGKVWLVGPGRAP